MEAFLINAQYRIDGSHEGFSENVIRQPVPPLTSMKIPCNRNMILAPKVDWCSHIIFERSDAIFMLHLTDNTLHELHKLPNSSELQWYFITENGKIYETKKPIPLVPYTEMSDYGEYMKRRYRVKKYRRHFGI